MHQKVNVLIIYIYSQNDSLKKSSLTNLLVSLLVFVCFHLAFQQAWLQWRRRRRRRRRGLIFRTIYAIGHACEACCEHPNIAIAKRMGEVRNFELGL